MTYKVLFQSITQGPLGDWIVTFSPAPWVTVTAIVAGERPGAAQLNALARRIGQWWTSRPGTSDLGVDE